MPDIKQELQTRLNEVKDRINRAAKKVNRNPDDIQLVAVSKNHELEKIRSLQELGLTLFGENRVQELQDKDEKSNFRIRWHFIGHLQRNKVKYLMRMENCEMIESLDSWRLAREINKRARKNNRIIPVLVEVNTSGDESKYGFDPEETVDFIKKASKLSHIELRGFMTLAPYLENPEQTRPYFQKLAGLRKKARREGFELPELSMGMTNDFEIAIEEGATIVRIGTAIFGKREY